MSSSLDFIAKSYAPFLNRSLKCNKIKEIVQDRYIPTIPWSKENLSQKWIVHVADSNAVNSFAHFLYCLPS